jgi:hypothetical protein
VAAMVAEAAMVATQSVAFSRFTRRLWHNEEKFQKVWHFKGLPVFFFCFFFTSDCLDGIGTEAGDPTLCELKSGSSSNSTRPVIVTTSTSFFIMPFVVVYIYVHPAVNSPP